MTELLWGFWGGGVWLLMPPLMSFLPPAQIEGVWHTSIVVHGCEWFFGYGVQHTDEPGSTPFGEPLKKLDLGCVMPQRPKLLRGCHNSCEHS
jgi:hypothetical protein